MTYARDLARLARRGVPTVGTVQELRGLPIYSGVFPKAVNVLGVASPGDGGGGLWHWDATSTETDDIGLILKSTSAATGRWKRQVKGNGLHVIWFHEAGGTDLYTAITKAISVVPDRESTGVAYAVMNTRKIIIPDGSWTLSQKVIVGTSKDLFLCGSDVGSTQILYTGPGHVAFQFDTSGVSSRGLENLILQRCSVAFVGSQSGRLRVYGCTFADPKENGLWFVDQAQYYDGNAITPGSYVPPPGLPGINTVGWEIDSCHFLLGDKHQITLDATTAHIAEIRRCRFLGSGETPLVMRCNFVNVIDCDFQGIATASTTLSPYIWFDSSAAYASVNSNTIERCRFAPEVYSMGGRPVSPPKRSIVVGGLTPETSGSGTSTFLRILNNWFLAATGSSEYCIYVNQAIGNCVIENNRSFKYTSDFVGFAEGVGLNIVSSFFGFNTLESGQLKVTPGHENNFIFIENNTHRGTRPTISPGTGENATVTGTMSSSSTNQAGGFSFTMGATVTPAGVLVGMRYDADENFAGLVTSVVIGPTNAAAAAAALYVTNISATGFNIKAGNTAGVLPNTVYSITYVSSIIR